MRLLQLWMAALTLYCIYGVADANAAATVTVTQTSEGVYSVSVANVAKAVSLDFTISYDIGTLSNPVILDGPFAAAVGAVQIPNNDSTFGTLRVVYVTITKDAFFEGGGQLATVTFTKTGTAKSRLPGLKSEVISAAGVQTAVQSIVTPLAGTDAGKIFSEKNTDEKAGTQANPNPGKMSNSLSKQSAQIGTSFDTVADQVSIPGVGRDYNPPRGDDSRDSIQEYAQNSQVGMTDIQGSTSPVISDGTAKNVSNKTADVLLGYLKSQSSVAERFRTYKGPRTLTGFSGLFDDTKLEDAGIVQTPRIAVSDGKSMITVKVSLPADSGVPSFLLKGANLKGIRNLSDRLLELDAVPQKGKSDVRISIIIQKEVTEIPLLVIPPVSGDVLSPSDQDLEKMLSKADTKNKTVLYDLNTDGKQDYLDDYILVAHWLMKQQGVKNAPASKIPVPR